MFQFPDQLSAGFDSYFEEGGFDTSLNQALHNGEGSVDLNVFIHVVGLEVDVDAYMNTGEEWDHAGEFPSMQIPKIPPDPATSDGGKDARFRRVTDPTEPF